MSLFAVDIRRLGLQLLPLCLRKPLMGALVYAVTHPSASVLSALLRYRSEVKEELSRNGQTCHLRRMLNDEFDPTRRGIRIIETGHSSGVTLHLRADGQEQTTPQTLNCRSYGGSTELDFAVRLPWRLRSVVDERRLTSMVRRYKLAGMRFGVEYTGVQVIDNLRGGMMEVGFEDRLYNLEEPSVAVAEILSDHYNI